MMWRVIVIAIAVTLPPGTSASADDVMAGPSVIAQNQHAT
jgi:hypothetical protein